MQNGLLTSDQQAFATELAAKTGLSPAVVGGWVLAEESGDAATGRQASNNNDWLNIGYTGSNAAGSNGTADAVWQSPLTAADATAAWLDGRSSIPGYGTASAGIQGILKTAGQSEASQVSAIQSSGWAASHYPELSDLVRQISESAGLGPNPDLNPKSSTATPVTGIPGANATGAAVTGAVSTVSGLISKLTDPSTWLRVAAIVGAGVLLIIGMIELAGGHPATDVVKGVSTAAMA
jgi:hypothetical protein